MKNKKDMQIHKFVLLIDFTACANVIDYLLTFSELCFSYFQNENKFKNIWRVIQIKNFLLPLKTYGELGRNEK